MKKLNAYQICFPKNYAQFLYNLFYMAVRRKYEKVILLNIYGGFEKYRDCAKEERLDLLSFLSTWNEMKPVIKLWIDTNVLLAQIDGDCTDG